MLSSVLPGLKRQGWHITLNTTETGEKVLRHDPHVDEWLVQAKDAVPNEQLGEFWSALASKYDRFLNFSETLEGTWLPMIGRPSFAWPHEVRKKYLDVNYLEFAHDFAGVPLPPEVKFYPTKPEERWAREQREALRDRFVILWALSGSSPHKASPHVDAVVAALLQNTENVHVVFVGDGLCRILEAGWEEDPRVWCRSAKWDVRKTLAFAEHADLVIGPETGVLNAVACLPMPKVVMLSHSSEENLTKHWTNTQSLHADVPCYPCHRLHGSRDYCPDKNGASLCMDGIGPKTIYRAILPHADAHALRRVA